VLVAGENAVVAYAGSAPTLESGIFQINVLLPSDLQSSSSLILTIGSASSPPFSIAIATR
jgi:uncharacterized protein (TIGR03437 family)